MSIELKNVNKSYFKDKVEINVLSNCSYEFKQNTFYAIYGKSGAGKSTMLNVISGLLSIDSGDVLYDGVSLTKMSDIQKAQFRNQDIGFVFQDYNLLNFLNIYENVIMPLVISGESSLSKSIKNKKALDIIEKVNLDNRIYHYPDELSGGEQQRVAIARALINDPKVLLCDEPTGSIDSENAKTILKMIKEISKSRIVIVVTHDDRVFKYADVILKFKNGNLVEEKNR